MHKEDELMTIRKALIFALIIGVSSPALAQSSSLEQQAACRPDVRRFCHQLKEADGNDAFMKCLQANRAKLSAPCRGVLESNHQ
jgi:hypothetical protein